MKESKSIDSMNIEDLNLHRIFSGQKQILKNSTYTLRIFI